MNQTLYDFVIYNSPVGNSRLIKLDPSDINVPHCYKNKEDGKGQYKMEFDLLKNSDDGYDIYLDTDSLHDLFIACVNEVRSSDKLAQLTLINVIHPEERYCYKSHQLADCKLLQLFNKPYKLYCNVLVEQESIDGKYTGRVIISFYFSFKLLFLHFGLNTGDISIKLNSDQLIEIQTKVYKEMLKDEDLEE